MWMVEGNGPLSETKHPPAPPCFLLPLGKRLEGPVWGGKIAHASWGE